MEFRHLATFQTIVKEGSFLKAADALGCAQPTVTLHVHQLEDDLGVRLFVRQGKRMHLTEAGRLLHEQAGQILNRAAALQETMAGISLGDAGHVRVGAIEPTASMRLPPLVAAYRRSRPRVRLTLDVAGTGEISRRVAAGELDVAVCSAPPAHLGLAFEPLFVERLALLVPRAHPLASQDRITVRSLAEQGVLLTQEGCAYRGVIERTMLERGANPYAGIEVTGIEVLKRCVQCGMGLAILPIAALDPPPPGTAVRDVADLDLSIAVGIALRPGDQGGSRALAAMVDDLRRGLRESS